MQPSCVAMGSIAGDHRGSRLPVGYLLGACGDMLLSAGVQATRGASILRAEVDVWSDLTSKWNASSAAQLALISYELLCR